MENLTQRWTQPESFFQKSEHFFRFSKRAGEVSPLPSSCALVSVTGCQFVVFKPVSYSFDETIGFDSKALFARRPVLRLIKPGDITKEC